MRRRLKTRPWTVVVDGECEAPGEIGIEDILSGFPQEERIYRLRCVEAWAMVVPWVGVPLGDLLKRFKPTSKAKYVAFETLVDPEQMPGQRRAVLDWPYREGLRMDEAMHPLTILATGLYGELMPESERCAAAPGGAVEIRFQEYQVDRAHQLFADPARDHLVEAWAGRVWFLFERESRGRSSPLESGQSSCDR